MRHFTSKAILYLFSIVILNSIATANYFIENQGQIKAIFNEYSFSNTLFYSNSKDCFITINEDAITFYDRLNPDNPKLTINFDSKNKIVCKNKALSVSNYYKGELNLKNIPHFETLELLSSNGNGGEIYFVGEELHFKISNLKYSIEGDKSTFKSPTLSHIQEVVTNGKFERTLGNEFIFEFSSYLGGSNYEIIHSVKSDKDGNYYLGGNSSSANFAQLPTKKSTDCDIWVAKLNSKNKILWFTYIGSSGEDYCGPLAIDSNQYVCVGGESNKNDFPVTSDAIVSTNSGGADCVVMRLNQSGQLTFATYLGGYSYDAIADMQVDKYSNIYTVGRTSSSSFTTTNDALSSYNQGYYDMVYFIIDSNNTLKYSTLIGKGQDDISEGITIVPSGDIVISGYSLSDNFPTTKGCYSSTRTGGYDAVLLCFDPNTNELKYSTYFGGYKNDYGSDVTADQEGNIFIHGCTLSPDLPTNNSSYQKNLKGINDDFIVKFDKNFNLKWCTYFGGSGSEGDDDIGDQAGGIACSFGTGLIAFGTKTTSSDMSTSINAIQKRLSNDFDAYVGVLNTSGKFVYGSYLGGKSYDNPYDTHFDRFNNLFLIGMTNSADFPTKAPLQAKIGGGYDGFIVKFAPEAMPDSISFKTSNLDCTSYSIVVATNNSFADVKATNQSNCNVSFEYNITRDTVFCSVTIVNAAAGAFVDLRASTIEGKTSNYHYDFSPAGIGAIAWNFAGKDSVVKFDTNAIAVQTCRTIHIYNKFDSPLVFKDAYLLGDTTFSFPHYQLPLTIPAKDSAEFILCFTPKNNTKKAQKDTLILALQCQKMIVPMEGPTAELELEGESNCGVFVRIRGDQASPISKFTAYSDPAGIVLSIQAKRDIENAQVKLYDLDGQERFELFSGKISNGDFSRIALCPGLQTGVYMIRLEYEDSIEVVKLVNTK